MNENEKNEKRKTKNEKDEKNEKRFSTSTFKYNTTRNETVKQNSCLLMPCYARLFLLHLRYSSSWEEANYPCCMFVVTRRTSKSHNAHC